MNALRPTAMSTSLHPGAQSHVPPRRWPVPLAVAVLRPAPAAPRPAPRQIASGLHGLFADGVQVPAPAPSRAAARAFAAGDSFLPGQMIDRCI